MSKQPEITETGVIVDPATLTPVGYVLPVVDGERELFEAAVIVGIHETERAAVDRVRSVVMAADRVAAMTAGGA